MPLAITSQELFTCNTFSLHYNTRIRILHLIYIVITCSPLTLHHSLEGHGAGLVGTAKKNFRYSYQPPHFPL